MKDLGKTAFQSREELVHAYKDVVYEGLRYSTSVTELRQRLDERLVNDMLPLVVTNPTTRDKMLEEFAEEPDIFAFQLGVIAGYYSCRTIPSSLEKIITPKSQEGICLEATIDHEKDNCFGSELYMQYALGSPVGTILVNRGLLVKYNGYLTGLCIDSFATETSTFVKGNWYSPLDKTTRIQLVTDQAKGRGVVEVHSGTWGLIRAATDTNRAKDVMLEAQERLTSQKAELPQTLEQRLRYQHSNGRYETFSSPFVVSYRSRF